MSVVFVSVGLVVDRGGGFYYRHCAFIAIAIAMAMIAPQKNKNKNKPPTGAR